MAKLDDTEIHRIVQNEIDDAVLYQEEEHTGFRDTATNYYYGKPPSQHLAHGELARYSASLAGRL